MKLHEQWAEQSAFLFEDLERARDASRQTGASILVCLEEQAQLSPEEFTRRLGCTFQYSVLSMVEMHQASPAFDLLPYTVAAQRGCTLLRWNDGACILVVGDPFDRDLLAWAQENIAVEFSVAIAHRADIAALLMRQEDTLRAVDDLLLTTSEDAEKKPAMGELSLRSINEDSNPIVKLVNSTLYDALKLGASDIHLETTADSLILKYRVDGVLTQVGIKPGLEQAEQVISRVKVISELDIAERRIPQDGRFKISVRNREIDFRVSIMPSIFGEDAVVRILDKRTLTDQANGLTLDALGFDNDAIAMIRHLSREPYGMVLVTGPTGSGKTTTLYAAISEINSGEDKIITIEDPVEYQLTGVLQIPVNEKKGLTFARGLRSILRHDPDKIMVGEIRDAETAQIAVQAALTGHLVFTTVHANNVFDVISRFTHMGVDAYSLVSALNGIVAQRLVRLNCPHCTDSEQIDCALLQASGISEAEIASFDFRHGLGCGQCRGTGYRGRKAIAEWLNLDDEIRELISNREPIRHVKAVAQRRGTRFLRDAALNMVRRGETSLQEINRVTVVA